jgi:hypothetical protein
VAITLEQYQEECSVIEWHWVWGTVDCQFPFIS